MAAWRPATEWILAGDPWAAPASAEAGGSGAGAPASSDDDGLVTGADGLPRCFWCGGHDDYAAYHDFEWGRPVADETRLFEKLCLEGFQSGLSWLTILRKREAFRAAFAGFDIDAVAEFGEDDVARIKADKGVVRHEKKIRSAINNARAAQKLRADVGGLAVHLWSFEPDRSERPSRLTRATIPAETPSSTRMAKDLKGRGFTFVGPTTSYALMQAMGMVNDHLDGCFLRDVVEQEREAFIRPS